MKSFKQRDSSLCRSHAVISMNIQVIMSKLLCTFSCESCALRRTLRRRRQKGQTGRDDEDILSGWGENVRFIAETLWFALLSDGACECLRGCKLGLGDENIYRQIFYIHINNRNGVSLSSTFSLAIRDGMDGIEFIHKIFARLALLENRNCA